MIDLRRKTCFLVTRILLLIILVISFSSCRNVKSTTELENHFTKKQIKDLNKINTFFINDVLNKKGQDFNLAFRNSFIHIYEYGIDTIQNNINYEKLKKLYKSISKSTFNEIWEVKTNTDIEFSASEYILPKYKGKFQLYLIQLRKSNPLADDAFQHMEASGDFNMMYFTFYLKENFKTIDFNDFNNQLIISIYYLSFIDQLERDPKAKKRRLELQKKVKSQIH